MTDFNPYEAPAATVAGTGSIKCLELAKRRRIHDLMADTIVVKVNV